MVSKASATSRKTMPVSLFSWQFLFTFLMSCTHCSTILYLCENLNCFLGNNQHSISLPRIPVIRIFSNSLPTMSSRLNGMTGTKQHADRLQYWWKIKPVEDSLVSGSADWHLVGQLMTNSCALAGAWTLIFTFLFFSCTPVPQTSSNSISNTRERWPSCTFSEAEAFQLGQLLLFLTCLVEL